MLGAVPEPLTEDGGGGTRREPRASDPGPLVGPRCGWRLLGGERRHKCRPRWEKSESCTGGEASIRAHSSGCRRVPSPPSVGPWVRSNKPLPAGAKTRTKVVCRGPRASQILSDLFVGPHAPHTAHPHPFPSPHDAQRTLKHSTQLPS